MRLNIIYSMRLVSVIVLLGMCLFILSSIVVVQPVHLVTQEDSIMTLNICNNHGSGVMNNPDT
ncbi:MAG: hypothetical protein ACK4Z9_07545, partial [Thermodesulfovibrionales bacterium]